MAYRGWCRTFERKNEKSEELKMIQIEINRWTIMKLEEAIEKYNKNSSYSIHDYVDMINKLLELYLGKVD